MNTNESKNDFKNQRIKALEKELEIKQQLINELQNKNKNLLGS